MISHLFEMATCYLVFAAPLMLSLLVLPALAVAPRLLRTPVLATAIPLVSMLMISCVAGSLWLFGHYQPPVVWLLTAIFIVVGSVRTSRYLRSNALAWRSEDLDMLGINLAICLPLVAMCGLSTFMHNDALASWNYWAMQFYHGDTPAMMGYPPLFPLFLSYAYQLLGTTEYQGVVKTLVVVFPFITMQAITVTSARTAQHVFLYLLLIACVVFPPLTHLSYYKFYAIGYADPMLVAMLSASVMFILRYLNDTRQKSFLWLAVLCGAGASLSKQPGLLWACFSLPLLLISKNLREKQWHKAEGLALMLLLLPPLVWLVTVGTHFYDNTGVIATSLQHDSNFYTMQLNELARTFVYSLYKYLWLRPSLLLLAILTVCAAWRSFYPRLILLSFVLPATLLWFVFGAYSLRLGLHILAVAAVLIVASDYFSATAWMQRWRMRWQMARIVSRAAFSMLKQRWFPRQTPPDLGDLLAMSGLGMPVTHGLRRYRQVLIIIGVCGFVSVSVMLQTNAHINTPYRIYPLQAGLSNIHHYYPQQANFVYEHLYQQPETRLLAYPRQVIGIFYGHNQLIPLPSHFDAESLYNHLLTYKPNYVLTALCSEKKEYCASIAQLALTHPELIKEITGSDVHNDYHVYAVTSA